METWQIAISGFLGVLALGVVQFIINSYMNKAERLKNKELEDLIKKVENVCIKLDVIQKTLNAVELQYKLLEQKFEFHLKEFEGHKKIHK